MILIRYTSRHRLTSGFPT